LNINLNSQKMKDYQMTIFDVINDDFTNNLFTDFETVDSKNNSPGTKLCQNR